MHGGDVPIPIKVSRIDPELNARLEVIQHPPLGKQGDGRGVMAGHKRQPRNRAIDESGFREVQQFASRKFALQMQHPSAQQGIDSDSDSGVGQAVRRIKMQSETRIVSASQYWRGRTILIDQFDAGDEGLHSS